MARHGYTQCTPRTHTRSTSDQPILSFSSGYVQRSLAALPRQGTKHPWKMCQNYALDLLGLRFAPVNDRALEFMRREPHAARAAGRGRTW
jgi:hypothetical protein